MKRTQRSSVSLVSAYRIPLILYWLGRPEPPFRTGLCFTRDVPFLFRHSFSEVPWPIALKLCHMIGIGLYFIIPLQKFGGSPAPPKKKWGKKHAKFQSILDHFRLWSKIGKRCKLWQFLIRLTKKSPVNFGPLTAWVWTHKNALFWDTISQPLGGVAPWKFYTR